MTTEQENEQGQPEEHLFAEEPEKCGTCGRILQAEFGGECPHCDRHTGFCELCHQASDQIGPAMSWDSQDVYDMCPECRRKNHPPEEEPEEDDYEPMDTQRLQKRAETVMRQRLMELVNVSDPGKDITCLGRLYQITRDERVEVEERLPAVVYAAVNYLIDQESQTRQDIFSLTKALAKKVKRQQIIQKLLYPELANFLRSGTNLTVPKMDSTEDNIISQLMKEL